MPDHSLGRRRFLRSVAPVLLAGTSLGAADPKRRIKAGFLGGGHAHAIGKWEVLSQSDQFELIGIAEEDPTIRAAFEKLGAAILSPEAIVEQSDVVLVESGVADHARGALLALAGNKHVHVEKPPSDNLADFQGVLELAREKQRILQMGYMWRYHPGFGKIFEAVSKGWLGDIYFVRGEMNTDLAPGRRPQWAEFHGGSMFELGCHLIDAIVRLLGKPAEVHATLKTSGSFGDQMRDNCLAVLEFANAQAIVSTATLQPNAGSHRTFEVLGTKGTATLSPIEPPRLLLDLAEQSGPYPAGKSEVHLPRYRRYVGDFEALAAAIQGKESLGIDFEKEFAVQQTVLKASEML